MIERWGLCLFWFLGYHEVSNSVFCTLQPLCSTFSQSRKNASAKRGQKPPKLRPKVSSSFLEFFPWVFCHKDTFTTMPNVALIPRTKQTPLGAHTQGFWAVLQSQLLHSSLSSSDSQPQGSTASSKHITAIGIWVYVRLFTIVPAAPILMRPSLTSHRLTLATSWKNPDRERHLVAFFFLSQCSL